MKVEGGKGKGKGVSRAPKDLGARGVRKTELKFNEKLIMNNEKWKIDTTNNY